MEDLEIVGDRGLEVVCSLGVVGSAGAISFFVFVVMLWRKCKRIGASWNLIGSELLQDGPCYRLDGLVGFCLGGLGCVSDATIAHFDTCIG